MARLRTKYRDSVADVPALNVEAAPDVPSAAASTPPHDDGTASSRLREQLEVMRERVSAPPPPSSAVDDAVEAAKHQQAVLLERQATPEPEPDDDGADSLGSSGLPPLACHWLRSHPEFLTDESKNAALQNLHWELVAQGYEGYSPEYFLEVDRRLNGHGAQPEPYIDQELADAERQLEAVERKRDRIGELNKQYDRIIEDTKSPVDRVLDEIRAAKNSGPAVNASAPRKAMVSAPPSRESPSWTGGRTNSNSRITLSPQQKEAARIAGISEVQYAANLLRLHEEKQNGNYGGQL